MAFDVLSFVMGQQTAKSGGGSDIELIENMPFVVDFSEGDQFIEAPEGYAVKSAVVKKPENLVAENIAEGVDIAGIIGTLASGGSGGNIVTSYKYIYPTNGQSFTVEHGLGVKPDIVIVYTTNDTILEGKNLYVAAMGCSKAYKDAGLNFPANMAFYKNSSGELKSQEGYGNIDVSGSRFLINANETSITLQAHATNYNWSTEAFKGYNLFCFGGLI